MFVLRIKHVLVPLNSYSYICNCLKKGLMTAMGVSLCLSVRPVGLEVDRFGEFDYAKLTKKLCSGGNQLKK